MNPKKISRRNFIRMSAVGAGCLCLSSCFNNGYSRYYIITSEESEIIDALADQIIPPDDFAGGSEAGVTNYIDRQLAGFYREHLPMYRACLKGLDETCRRIYGKGFTALDAETGFQFLKDIENGQYNEEDWQGHRPSAFFGMLRNHCLQGFYGSPRHGGNENYVSYQMMRLDYPLIIGRNVH